MKDTLNQIKAYAHLSPYRLGKLMQIRPQMVYNYIRHGYIKATANSTGKMQVSQAEAIRFATKYLSKKEK